MRHKIAFTQIALYWAIELTCLTQQYSVLRQLEALVMQNLLLVPIFQLMHLANMIQHFQQYSFLDALMSGEAFAYDSWVNMAKGIRPQIIGNQLLTRHLNCDLDYRHFLKHYSNPTGYLHLAEGHRMTI
jgi:hypothetical protein